MVEFKTYDQRRVIGGAGHLPPDQDVLMGSAEMWYREGEIFCVLMETVDVIYTENPSEDDNGRV